MDTRLQKARDAVVNAAKEFVLQDRWQPPRWWLQRRLESAVQFLEDLEKEKQDGQK
jgi:hypothetical protein